MTDGNVSWDTQTVRIQQYMYMDCTLITERFPRAADEFGSYPPTCDLK